MQSCKASLAARQAVLQHSNRRRRFGDTAIMAERGWETLQGLCAILESPRWPIAKKCQAVDGCLDVNRCTILSLPNNKLLRASRLPNYAQLMACGMH